MFGAVFYLDSWPDYLDTQLRRAGMLFATTCFFLVCFLLFVTSLERAMIWVQLRWRMAGCLARRIWRSFRLDTRESKQQSIAVAEWVATNIGTD